MENGKCAIAKNLVNGLGFGSTEFHVMRVGESVTPEWIYYFIRQKHVTKQLESKMRGSAGQKRVPAEAVEELLVPLPPLPEQRRIAALLGKADHLRRTRRYATHLSQTFLRAVFVRMFRDALTESTPSTLLGDMVKITGGGTPRREIERHYRGRIPWLTSKDMRGDYIVDTQEHITEEAVRKSATKLIPAGSVLIVVKSKILMRRLPLAIAQVPLCHGQDVKSIQCSEKINNLFALHLLKYNEPRLLNQARGVNTEGLTLPMLQEVRVPSVPAALQLEFARIAHRFKRVRAQQWEAQRQADHLFQTLLHRTFDGHEIK